jgi:hypothetical protein
VPLFAALATRKLRARTRFRRAVTQGRGFLAVEVVVRADDQLEGNRFQRCPRCCRRGTRERYGDRPISWHSNAPADKSGR